MATPERIGRYEIRGELGRGGFATVYHGWDPRFEREVAIKFLPPELIHADPQFKMRFEREAKIIAQLEHPSIVPVYDVGEENGQPYFVMRYMNGGSLSERIRGKTYSIEETIKVIEQIAPGLDEAHSKGIVHRDLKPANILFTNKNVPLISDFGIAKFSQGDNSSNMTGSAIIGTPAYMAPEQASGDVVDGRADIYALGVILYEMVTTVSIRYSTWAGDQTRHRAGAAYFGSQSQPADLDGKGHLDRDGEKARRPLHNCGGAGRNHQGFSTRRESHQKHKCHGKNLTIQQDRHCKKIKRKKAKPHCRNGHGSGFGCNRYRRRILSLEQWAASGHA